MKNEPMAMGTKMPGSLCVACKRAHPSILARFFSPDAVKTGHCHRGSANARLKEAVMHTCAQHTSIEIEVWAESHRAVELH